MERLEVNSPWLDPPTFEQVRDLNRVFHILGKCFMEEDMPANKRDARNLIKACWDMVAARNTERKVKRGYQHKA